MANPERSPAGRTSAVAECAATDCRHNENRNCTAGEIQVRFTDGKAVCGTYAPEKPKARP